MDDDEEDISCRYLVQPLNRKTSKVKINILQTEAGAGFEPWVFKISYCKKKNDSLNHEKK
jgi:hypothetical protein